MKTFVLVVEDNLANQELLQDWLEAEGFDVVSAGNLQSALNALGLDPKQSAHQSYSDHRCYRSRHDGRPAARCAGGLQRLRAQTD
jgi:hypothetical protein